jgi:hypothetical protein
VHAALVLVIVSYAMLAATRSYRTAPRLARIPRLTLAVVSVLGLAGLSVAVLTRTALGAEPGPGPVAAARTGVLAVAAAALALTRRRTALPELGWLAGALLAVGAAKILLEDLRSGGSGPLFVAFGLYGLALIAVPRLLRTPGPAHE